MAQLATRSPSKRKIRSSNLRDGNFFFLSLSESTSQRWGGQAGRKDSVQITTLQLYSSSSVRMSFLLVLFCFEVSMGMWFLHAFCGKWWPFFRIGGVETLFYAYCVVSGNWGEMDSILSNLDQEQVRLMNADECILVDEEDNVLGHASKKTCNWNWVSVCNVSRSSHDEHSAGHASPRV